MVGRIFTLPRLMFIIVFGYINANLSAWFAYSGSTPGIIDYIAGFFVAFFLLGIGFSIGTAILKKYSSHIWDKERKGEFWFQEERENDYLSDGPVYYRMRTKEYRPPIRVEITGLVISTVLELAFIAFIIASHT
jgi:hypothetical protein